MTFAPRLTALALIPVIAGCTDYRTAIPDEAAFPSSVPEYTAPYPAPKLVSDRWLQGPPVDITKPDTVFVFCNAPADNPEFPVIRHRFETLLRRFDASEVRIFGYSIPFGGRIGDPTPPDQGDDRLPIIGEPSRPEEHENRRPDGSGTFTSLSTPIMRRWVEKDAPENRLFIYPRAFVIRNGTVLWTGFAGAVTEPLLRDIRAGKYDDAYRKREEAAESARYPRLARFSLVVGAFGAGADQTARAEEISRFAETFPAGEQDFIRSLYLRQFSSRYDTRRRVLEKILTLSVATQDPERRLQWLANDAAALEKKYPYTLRENPDLRLALALNRSLISRLRRDDDIRATARDVCDVRPESLFHAQLTACFAARLLTGKPTPDDLALARVTTKRLRDDYGAKPEFAPFLTLLEDGRRFAETGGADGVGGLRALAGESEKTGKKEAEPEKYAALLGTLALTFSSESVGKASDRAAIEKLTATTLSSACAAAILGLPELPAPRRETLSGRYPF